MKRKSERFVGDIEQCRQLFVAGMSMHARVKSEGLHFVPSHFITDNLQLMSKLSPCYMQDVDERLHLNISEQPQTQNDERHTANT